MPCVEQMDKEIVAYTYNADHSALKEKEILPFGTIQMNLENIMLHAISQS